MFKLDNKVKLLIVLFILVLIISQIDFRCNRENHPSSHTVQIDSLYRENNNIRDKALSIIDSGKRFNSEAQKNIHTKKTILDEKIQAIDYLPIDTLLIGISRELSKESSNR